MIVREKCAQIEIQRTLKKQDFGFCKKVIYTPYEYRESIESKKKYKNLSQTQKHAKRNRNSQKYFRSRTPRRRKFIRESISYKKGHKSKPHQFRKPSHTKCSCFICGDPKHFANKCPKKFSHENIDIINLIEGLDDDIVSLIDNEVYEVYNICS